MNRLAFTLRMMICLGLAAWTLGSPGALHAIHLLPADAQAAVHARAGDAARQVVSAFASHDKSKPANDLIDGGHDHSPSLSSLFAILASAVMIEGPLALKPMVAGTEFRSPVPRGADPPMPRPPSSI